MQTLTINPAAQAHIANIEAKAATLFTSAGYSYRQHITNGDLFDVCNPAMRANPALPCYTVNVAAETCTCGGWAQYKTCSHLVACIEEVRLIALVAAHDEADAFGPGDLVLAYLKNKPAPVGADGFTENEVCAGCGSARQYDDGGPLSFCEHCEMHCY